MEYTLLGHSDLKVSRICLGCMGFGDQTTGQHSWTVDEAASREIIREALALGINFFDTSIIYQQGSSERYLGRALRDMVSRREDVVVATKFLPRSAEEIAQGISGQEHVRASLDQSLENLGLDYVDLYIYHIWDYKTPLEEILEGMNEAVRSGKARYLGLANVHPYQIAKVNALAEQRGWAKVISVQNHYNLLMREEEREMFQLCAEDGIAMTPYSALASGKLSRRPGQTSQRYEQDAYLHRKYDATAEEDALIIARVADLADKYGVSMTEVSLAWMLTKVDSPIIGATKLSHVQGAARALDLRLSAEDIVYLEELYRPHPISGVLADNKPVMSSEPVWVTHAKGK